MSHRYPTSAQRILALKGPILVFGAGGFIGANLTKAILKHRRDCYAVTRDPDSAWRLRLLSLPTENIVCGNVLNKSSIQALFRKHAPGIVFDLSAYGAYAKQDVPELIYQTNVTGLVNILEECSGVSAFVHSGSSSEYGPNCDNPDENDPLLPNSHYAASKISASYILKFYGRSRSLPCLSLRLFSIYGPWEEPDRLIPRLLASAKRGQWPPLAAPQIARDFVYVADAVEAFLQAALNLTPSVYGDSLNIGSGKQTSLQELVQLAAELFQVKQSPVWSSMANRAWDLEKWRGNYGKAQQTIGWEPRVTLREGLLRTSQWQDDSGYAERVLPAFAARQETTKTESLELDRK